VINKTSMACSEFENWEEPRGGRSVVLSETHLASLLSPAATDTTCRWKLLTGPADGQRYGMAGKGMAGKGVAGMAGKGMTGKGMAGKGVAE